jgi:hypothetical protein
VTAVKKDQEPSTGEGGNTYFDDVHFTNVAGSAYYSDNKYYWPGTYNLDFYAYSPEATGDIERVDYKTFVVKANATAASQVDFVYAIAKDWGTASGATNDGKNGVRINFRHAESKVVVKLKNSNPNLTFDVGNVTLGNIYNKGKFTSALTTTAGDGNLTNNEWKELNTDNSSPAAYTATFTQAYTETLSATPTQAGVDMILIPQTLTAATAYSGVSAGDIFNGAYITVQIKIKNTDNGAYIINDGTSYLTALWPLKSLQWVPGYKYTYTIDLAQGGYYNVNQDGDSDLDPILEGAEIFFAEATVDDWDDADPINISGALTAVAGTTQTITVARESGQYWITVNGFTAGKTVNSEVTGAGTFTITSGASATVGSTGTVTISGNLTENSGSSAVTNTITLTDNSSTPVVTVINLVQPGS